MNAGDQTPGFAVDLRTRDAFLAAFRDTHEREEMRLTARRSLRPGEAYRLQLHLPAGMGSVTLETVVMGVSPGPGGLEDERVIIDMKVRNAPSEFWTRVRGALQVGEAMGATGRLTGRMTAPVIPSNQPPSVTGEHSRPAERSQPAPKTRPIQALTGNFPAQTGSVPIQTGGIPAPTGAFPAQTGGKTAPTGAFPAQTHSAPAQTGAIPAQTGAFPAQGAPPSTLPGSGGSVGPARDGSVSGTHPAAQALVQAGQVSPGNGISGIFNIPPAPGMGSAIPAPQTYAAKPPPAGIPLERNPGVEDFVVALVKALTNTGVYATDSPEAVRTRHQLFGQIGSLTLQLGGDVVLERPDAQKIDGIELGRVGPLTQLMSRGRSDLWLPKLGNFMQRRRLTGLGFAAGLSEAEFGAFLRVMATPPTSPDTARSDISIALNQAGIQHVQLRFEGETLTGEKLSSAAQIVLTRLGNDLRSQPLFRQEDTAHSRELKAGHLRDLMRPITGADDLRDILLHCDRLEDDWNRSSPGWPLIHALTSVLGPSTRVAGAISIVRSYRSERERAKLSHESDFDQLEPRYRSVLGQMASVFLDERTTETDRILKQLQQERMIGYEDLTEAVRERLAATKVTDELLANAPATLGAYRDMSDQAAYRRTIGAFRRALPELVRRGELATLRQLLSIAAQHSQETRGPFPARPMLARELIKAASTPHMLHALLGAARETRPAARKELVAALVFLGPTAAGRLLRASAELAASDRRPETDSAIGELLTQVFVGSGRQVIRALIRALEAEQAPTPARPGHPEHGQTGRRAVALALAQLGDMEGAPLAARLVDDPQSAVRVSALRTVMQLKGRDAEEDLVRALGDPELTVQKVAVAALASLRSQSARAFDYYRRTLQMSGSDPEVQALISEVCRAIATLAREDVPHVGELETVLLAELEREGRGKSRNTVAYKMAACDALAGFALRSERSRRFLNKLVGDRDLEVRRKAQDALSEI